MSGQDVLKQYFWDAIQHGVILCSATIRSLGNFDYYCAEMGLNEMAKTIHLPSPLPYQHSVLNIPQLQHSPQQSTEHIAEKRPVRAAGVVKHMQLVQHSDVTFELFVVYCDI